MTDLAAFLTERLDEDEQLARTADAEPFPDKGFQRGTHIAYGLQSTGIGLEYQGFALVWDPARVLAEITAKRRILEDYRIVIAKRDGEPDKLKATAFDLVAKSLRMVLCRLAAVHEGHEDFDPTWSVT